MATSAPFPLPRAAAAAAALAVAVAVWLGSKQAALTAIWSIAIWYRPHAALRSQTGSRLAWRNKSAEDRFSAECDGHPTPRHVTHLLLTGDQLVWYLSRRISARLVANTVQQGVALTDVTLLARRACHRGAIMRQEAAWRHRLACAGEAACRPAEECHRRRQQTPASVSRLAPYTVCRRASSNANRQLFYPNAQWKST